MNLYTANTSHIQEIQEAIFSLHTFTTGNKTIMNYQKTNPKEYKSFVTNIYRFVNIGHDAKLIVDNYTTLDWIKELADIFVCDIPNNYNFYFNKNYCVDGLFCWPKQPFRKKLFGFVKSLPVINQILRGGIIKRVKWYTKYRNAFTFGGLLYEITIKMCFLTLVVMLLWQLLT